MSNITKKLGASFESVAPNLKYKTIKISYRDQEFALTIRIPLKKEMEQLIEKISSPSEKKIDKYFEEVAKTVRTTMQTAGDAEIEALEKVVELKDDDVILNGNSLKLHARMKAMWATKVESYFALIKSQTDEPVNETYEELSKTFDDEEINIIIKEIEQAIKPDYKTAKKN